jgi:hypothetical protein
MPNDGGWLGRRASIDFWLRADKQYSSGGTALTLLRDAPHHAASYGFEDLPDH